MVMVRSKWRLVACTLCETTFSEPFSTVSRCAADLRKRVRVLQIKTERSVLTEMYRVSSPFFGFKSWRWVPWNQEECTHRMHVTKCCKYTQYIRNRPVFHIAESKKKSLRGAPSAISIAVMPQDHRSLCNKSRASTTHRGMHAQSKRGSYSIVVCRIWILITGDNFRGHPIGSTNEGVSSAHGSIELGTYTEVHWEGGKS